VEGTKSRAQNRPPVETVSELVLPGGRDRRRSGDLTLFRSERREDARRPLTRGIRQKTS
jgi:hypothetical protein